MNEELKYRSVLIIHNSEFPAWAAAEKLKEIQG
jgi:hypothetical protein